ncbi:MAG: hypothetical protein ACYCY1_17025, partial [Sulfuriferula sp.]
MTQQEALEQLAALHGIATDYYDIWGNIRHTNEGTQRALLAAMGVELDGDLCALLAEHEARPWRRLLPPVLVMRTTDDALAVPVTFPSAQAAATYRWILSREEGGREERKFQP